MNLSRAPLVAILAQVGAAREHDVELLTHGPFVVVPFFLTTQSDRSWHDSELCRPCGLRENGW